jgi:hypothetical protein
MNFQAKHLFGILLIVCSSVVPAAAQKATGNCVGNCGPNLARQQGVKPAYVHGVQQPRNVSPYRANSAYSAQQQDMRDYAAKVKYYNELKKQQRENLQLKNNQQIRNCRQVNC